MAKTKKLQADKPKKKILIYGDFPEVPTGFATVTRNLAKHLHKKGYSIDFVGINLNEGDLVKIPYVRYYRAARSNRDNDSFGRNTLIQAINGLKGTTDSFYSDYDYVFLLQDHFILENNGKSIGEALRRMQADRKAKGAKVFKTIFYCPIDGEMYDKWLIELLNYDVVIPFSKFGQEEIIRSAEETIKYYEDFDLHVDDMYLDGNYNHQDFEVKKNEVLERISRLGLVIEKARTYAHVYHGSDTSIFRPLLQKEVDKFRKDYFKGQHERFIVGVVNRNQPRKDISRAIEIFNEFRKKRPDAFLYLHMDLMDGMGMDLRAVCNGLGMIEGKDYAGLNTYGLDWTNVTPKFLNYIYNGIDCYLTTTLGEGWGLTITEAMSAYCPVVAPENTTIPEILGDGERGVVVALGEQATYTKGDFQRKRRRMDLAKGVEALESIYSMDDDVLNYMCGKALAWINNHTWDIEVKNLVKLIEG